MITLRMNINFDKISFGVIFLGTRSTILYIAMIVNVGQSQIYVKKKKKI